MGLAIFAVIGGIIAWWVLNEPPIVIGIFVLCGAIGFIVLSFLAYAKVFLKLEPKLRMFFVHDDPCEQTMFSEGGGIIRLFRVGIENKSGTTVEGVQVKLETIDPPDYRLSQRLPAQLHRMHDNPPDELQSHWETEFRVRPGDVEYIDVVDKLKGEHSDNNIRFWLKPLGGWYHIPCKRYTIRLAAHARNSMECIGKFVIDVNEKGQLSFEPSFGAGAPTYPNKVM